MDIARTFRKATAGHLTTPNNWISATALRPLFQNDPCLIWLRWHGKKHGFEEDPKEYSFLEFIGEKGREFEDKWVKEGAPHAVQCLDDDRDVCKSESVLSTLALLQSRAPVITKAALWWAPERIYGTADLIARTSWLYKRFPHLAPASPEPDHYVVLDAKFISKMDTSDKHTDLLMASTQVRMYSYMLGHLQGYMPKRAYLVTRDRPFDPIPVEVGQKLGEPLDQNIAEKRDQYLEIKLRGGNLRPWRNPKVAPNFSNNEDAPWHNAKKRIAREFIKGGPLQWLPKVGRAAAEALTHQGYRFLDDLLAVSPAKLDLEALPGIGRKAADRIRAVLNANRRMRASVIPADNIPSRADVELFVDYEYFTNVHVDFESQWPAMEGNEMVFMIGVGWDENGRWRYKQFVAEREDKESERAIFEQFLSFLDQRGAFKQQSTAALYHWTPAEVWQSARAAERHGLERLRQLPWVDLHEVFHAVPIGIPGAWGYGLKEIAGALGQYSPKHRVDWPEELGAGLGAMVMGWRAYEEGEPLATREMKILSEYLEVDCKAMWAVLRWLRHSADQHRRAATLRGGWYQYCKMRAATTGHFGH